jgi:hypothetical protein
LTRFCGNSLFEHNQCGAMVQRLARDPFKVETRVRFSLALPKLRTFHFFVVESLNQNFDYSKSFSTTLFHY